MDWTAGFTAEPPRPPAALVGHDSQFVRTTGERETPVFNTTGVVLPDLEQGAQVTAMEENVFAVATGEAR